MIYLEVGKNMTRVTKEGRKVESTNCIFSRGG